MESGVKWISCGIVCEVDRMRAIATQIPVGKLCSEMISAMASEDVESQWREDSREREIVCGRNLSFRTKTAVIICGRGFDPLENFNRDCRFCVRAVSADRSVRWRGRSVWCRHASSLELGR